MSENLKCTVRTPMTIDLRALLQQMADELDHSRQCLMDDRSLTHPLADQARAALAEEVA